MGVDGKVVYDGKLTQIKGRGNSTWVQSAKKSYQIKLDKKCDLLQTGNKDNKNKTWTLITDYLDGTSLRNATAYELAQRLGVRSAVDYGSVSYTHLGAVCIARA